VLEMILAQEKLVFASCEALMFQFLLAATAIFNIPSSC
jgi:hypothetical protein